MKMRWNTTVRNGSEVERPRKRTVLRQTKPKVDFGRALSFWSRACETARSYAKIGTKLVVSEGIMDPVELSFDGSVAAGLKRG